MIYTVLSVTNNINMYIYSDPFGDPIFRLNIYYGDLIMET